MKFYDTHMHSHLSFDSFESPKCYMNEKTEFITFTEHLDLENTANGGQDDIPDFEEHLTWRETFNNEYQVNLLMGVEIGYVPSHQKRLEKILEPYHFDLKLLSVHQNNDYDYMDEATGEAPEVMINNYLNQLLEALDQMDNCQIMTHFDYGFRIHHLTADELGPYEGKLMRIFEKCAQQGLAFELNSKSLWKYNNRDLYEWAIPRFQSVGGNLFSLGSDAHKADEHFMNFLDSIELLEQFDVTAVAQYQQQELYSYPIVRLKKELANK